MSIPTATEVRAKLEALSLAQLEELAKLCSVPYHTLIKVRNGQTENPRIETVRAVWPLLRKTRGAR